MNTALLITSVALLAGSSHAVSTQRPSTNIEVDQETHLISCISVQSPPKVEVVFVLDTTGSMGGLIESAKEKIWSIATTIAQAQPSPEIRMGLVAYRDRGDDYITKRTELTEDLDALYSELSSFEARGGGDGPESVNQALFEAVERFGWTEGEDVLRIIYLVGDAPPKMSFEDDVKYPASCKFAREKGILINTIQCGSMGGTKEVWQTIAQNTNGQYAAIAQDGGTRSIATPYDDEIKELDQELSSLMLDYGDSRTLKTQAMKRERSFTLSESVADEAAADRAVYNQSLAGRSNLYGRQELVNDYFEGKVTLAEIPQGHLPTTLQDKPETEIIEIITANQSQRQEIAARLGELAISRRDFQTKAREEAPISGFDARVVEILIEQAAAIGLKIQNEE